MKRWFPPAVTAIAVIAVCGLVVASWRYKRERAEQVRFERGETELVLSNLARVPVQLFKAGKNFGDARPVTSFNGERIWLPAGDYFLKASYPSRDVFYPAPIAGYRRGPDADGSFVVTIRTLPDETPPSTSAPRDNWALIPSGNFLFGDRQNPRESHYVWLPAFFIARFEIANAEFSEFLRDASGYASESNWTAAPSEAEWEKAARGPDGFDFALSRSLSDGEVNLYNWKKNPGAEITVVGASASQTNYQPNRYGLYHPPAMSSNGQVRSRDRSTANGPTSTPRGIVRTLMRLASRAEAPGTAPASRSSTFPAEIPFSPKPAITTWASESSPGRCHNQRLRKSSQPAAQNSSTLRGAFGGLLFQTKIAEVMT